MERNLWNFTELNTSLTNNMQFLLIDEPLYVVTILFMIGLVFIISSDKERHELVTGGGVSIGMYLLFCIFNVLLFKQSNIITWLILSIGSHSWIFPFNDVSDFFLSLSKLFTILGKVRKQLPIMAPYTLDLLPYFPKMMTKMDVILDNIEIMGEAMPKMMEEKKYILPLMDDIIDKLELVAPSIPLILPIFHKVAPHMSKMLPKIEIVAPYMKDLIPLWDELEPHLDTMLLEMDNLAPLLPELAKDMDKMIPVLNLMPIMHESGVLNSDLVKKSLPFMTKLLPRTQDVLMRSILSKSSDTAESFIYSSFAFYEKHKQKFTSKTIEEQEN